MEREQLLNQLTMLDFMATDLCLYLDTHPEDYDALKKYNAVIIHADKARCAYEKKYGSLCSYRSLNKGGWEWCKDPWPWSREFNYDLIGEEK